MPVKAMHITELQQVSKGRPFDIAFVCTKSYDTAWATMMVRNTSRRAATSSRCRTA